MDALVAGLALTFAASLALGGPPRFLPPWTAGLALSAAMLARLWLRERRAGRGPLQSRPQAALFWLCLTLYLSSLRWHGGDDIPASMLPFCILRHGTLGFEPVRAWAEQPALTDLIIEGAGGRLVSFYPIAPAVLALPLYLVPALVGVQPSDVFLHNMAKLAGALITAVSVLALYRAAARRASSRWAAVAALLYGLGSFAFSVSSQALYSHGPAQLGVALGLLGLLTPGRRWAALSGLGLGLAAVSREDSAFFGLAAAAYLSLHERRRLPAFAAAAALPLLLNLAYWRWASGEFRPPYHATQSGMFVPLSPVALTAMLLSPARGLLLFMPAAAFGLWGAARACVDPRARWAPYFAAACVALWLFYGLRNSWTGGQSFGTRYFSVVAMMLAFFTAELEGPLSRDGRLRALWSAAFAASIVIHALGAYFTWPGVAMTLQQQRASLWQPGLHPAVELFLPRGGLGGLPAALRCLAAGLLLSLSIPIGLWAARQAGGK